MRTAIILLAAALSVAGQTNPYTSAADVAEGTRSFSSRCAGCHGAYGEGGRGVALNSGTFRHGGSDAEIFRTIRNGVPNTEMPGATQMDPDIWRLVAFVKQLSQSSATSGAAAGDPRAGKAVFARSGCASCHLIDGEGSDFGPDLSRVGTRPVAFIRDSIVEPNKELNYNYFAANVTTASGEKIRGIFLNEDEYSIQLRDTKGNPRSFLKRDLRDFQHEKESLMPSPSLAPADLDNLVAFLSTLRGAR